ncbi:hypothetical protein MLD38_019088 [Melastoma candidum]|uniref:Uncharacterized protein n=1 Tax=Melastoma candidum TaxID=119954 RepID=A0ACB9QWX8_9MYRT|nr:hypothetical protein MLD38_019088 [Melastoma candidum]
MAESVVNFLVTKVGLFLENEYKLLRVRQEELVSAKDVLERTQANLRITDSLEETDEEVRVWVKQLRECAYDMEDALDELKLVLTHDHDKFQWGSIQLGSIHRRLSCCVRNMKDRHRLTTEIRKISGRIKSVCAGQQSLRRKFNRARDDPSSSNTDIAWPDPRTNALLLDKTELLGMEEPKKKLVDSLLRGTSGREVISIVGMGGLGKSTLAMQVYEDGEVRKHFSVYAFINLSRYAKPEDLLKDMLRQIMRDMSKPVPPGADTMNSHWLKLIIRDLLQRRRYLIVLDDVWSIREWDAIKHALPNNDQGSRVMITTRDVDVASTACTEFHGEVYNMEPLQTDVSWELFCRKTFQGNPCPSHLEDICKHILRKCDGLPLAIVAISGVLATKETRRINEWDVVRRGLCAEIDGNDKLQNLKRVLLLSFGDLPYHLKACFLHLSVFPEGLPIERIRLVRLWIAEGFVGRKEGKTAEEVAEDYFGELMNRSLMQVAEMTTDGRVKSCRIHDFLRDIIACKSKDQMFATVAKDLTDTWPEKVRRLSIQSNQREILPTRSLSQLRSLYLFAVDKPFVDAILTCSMRLLTVLDLQAAPISKFPVQVVDCYYLIFLSLRNTEVKTIPRSIGKLQKLETLDLKQTNVTSLPEEVLKLQRLRHLLVYRYENVSYNCSKYGFKALDGIGAMQSLQKLCYIEADSERNSVVLKEIGKLTQLTRLAILKMRKEDGRYLCSSIAKLTSLQAMSVSAFNDDEILDLNYLRSPPQLLQRIYLSGRLELLPSWIANIHGLVKLNLKWSRLKEDPLETLQKLPNLVVLELLQVYNGKSLCFKAKGFKKLKILGLDYFEELRTIDIEEDAMPNLEKLVLQRCKLFQELPSGIENLTKLKVLEFFDMPEELIRRIAHYSPNKDYQKVARVPEVYYGLWRDGRWDVQSIERSDEAKPSPRPRESMRSFEFPPCWK